MSFSTPCFCRAEFTEQYDLGLDFCAAGKKVEQDGQEWLAQCRRVPLQRLWLSQHREDEPKAEVDPAETARYRVLRSSTELLEAILLQLPAIDLLFAQLINRRVKAVMDHSPSIQQALFFQPAPIKARHHLAGPTANPLFASKFFPSTSVLVVEDKSPEKITYIRGVYMHQAPYSPRRRQCLERFRAVLSLRTTTLKRKGHEGRPLSRFHLGGSWRRMYLTQPPCATWTMVGGRLDPARVLDTGLRIEQMFKRLTWPGTVRYMSQWERWKMWKAAAKRSRARKTANTRMMNAALKQEDV